MRLEVETDIETKLFENVICYTFEDDRPSRFLKIKFKNETIYYRLSNVYKIHAMSD